MINIELISPEKNAAIVRSVNGMTGDVSLEIPSIEGLATEEYVQERIASIEIPEGGGGSSGEGVSYEFGNGLQNVDNVVSVNADKTLAFNNGKMYVNTNNLYQTSSNKYLLKQELTTTVPMTNELTTFSVEMTTDWFAELSNNDTIAIRFVNSEMGFGGTCSVVFADSARDGNSYSFLLDMDKVIGKSMFEATGMKHIQVGYNEGLITFILERDADIALTDINYIELGTAIQEKSFAHYYIRKPRQFVVEGQRIMINEDYLNEMIDARLDTIPVAEEVSV